MAPLAMQEVQIRHQKCWVSPGTLTAENCFCADHKISRRGEGDRDLAVSIRGRENNEDHSDQATESLDEGKDEVYQHAAMMSENADLNWEQISLAT